MPQELKWYAESSFDDSFEWIEGYIEYGKLIYTIEKDDNSVYAEIKPKLYNLIFFPHGKNGCCVESSSDVEELKKFSDKFLICYYQDTSWQEILE